MKEVYNYDWKYLEIHKPWYKPDVQFIPISAKLAFGILKKIRSQEAQSKKGANSEKAKKDEYTEEELNEERMSNCFLVNEGYEYNGHFKLLNLNNMKYYKT